MKKNKWKNKHLKKIKLKKNLENLEKNKKVKCFF